MLARFIQADTVVPGAGSPLAWDRYAYVNNNPLRFTDPSGHWLCSPHRPCEPTTPPKDGVNLSAGDLAEIGLGLAKLAANIHKNKLTIESIVLIPLSQSGDYVKYTTDISLSGIRAVGRAIGNSELPISHMVGLPLALGPAQLKNFQDLRQGTPWEEVLLDSVADAFIDTRNYFSAELAGKATEAIAFASTDNPLVAISSSVVADIGVGQYLDTNYGTDQDRQALATYWAESMVLKDPYDDPTLPQPHPAPVPPSPNPIGTPIP